MVMGVGRIFPGGGQPNSSKFHSINSKLRETHSTKMIIGRCQISKSFHNPCTWQQVHFFSKEKIVEWKLHSTNLAKCHSFSVMLTTKNDLNEANHINVANLQVLFVSKIS